MSQQATIRAIIGLGNPGARFTFNRHNIGFRVVDHFAERFHGTWKESDTLAYAEIKLPAELADQGCQLSPALLLIKPLTYMNTSGRVIPFLTKKGIQPQEILVVHDELEKKFGYLGIRLGGSARGHNGLRSIIGLIGEQFWRLRFGIGRPERKEEVADFVLSNFTKDEAAQMDGLLDQAVDMLTRPFSP